MRSGEREGERKRKREKCLFIKYEFISKWNFIKIITQSSHIIDFKITQNWNCFHKLTIKAHRKEMWNQNHTHAHAIPSHESQSQHLSTIPFIFNILPHPNNTAHLHLDKLASLHTEKSYLILEVWVWGYFRRCTFVAICSDGGYGHCSLLSHVHTCTEALSNSLKSSHSHTHKHINERISLTHNAKERKKSNEEVKKRMWRRKQKRNGRSKGRVESKGKVR